MTRPVVIALAASLLSHALGLSWVLTRPEVEQLPVIESALDLVLLEVQPPEAPVPIPPEPDPLRQEDPQPLAEQVVSERPTPPRLPAKVITTVPRELATEAAPALNLSRPDGWNSPATETPENIASSAFKKSTRDAVALRQQERARSQALSRAQVERLGLPAEEYRRLTDAGEEVKTAKGCFIKRPVNGPNGRSERWWRTGCRDSRVPAWKREVLTFGPDHRVIPNSPASPSEP